MKDYRLKIIGDGPLLNELKNIYQKTTLLGKKQKY